MYSPYGINRFLFVMEKQLVSCEDDTENLKAKIRFVLRKVHKLTLSDFCCIIHGQVRKFCAVNKVFQFSGKSQLHSASVTELLYTVLCGSVSKNEIVHWANKPVRYPHCYAKHTEIMSSFYVYQSYCQPTRNEFGANSFEW